MSLTTQDKISDYEMAMNYLKGLSFIAKGPLTRRLMKRTEDDAREILRLTRLERALAIDRGDESVAPDGWYKSKAGNWFYSYDNEVMLLRVDGFPRHNGLTGWELTLVRHGPTKEFELAIDAMEWAMEQLA
jgi:hypothetical protein